MTHIYQELQTAALKRLSASKENQRLNIYYTNPFMHICNSEYRCFQNV